MLYLQDDDHKVTSIPGRILSIANHCADSTAVISADCSYTYGELTDLCGRLAEILRRYGAQEGTVIPIITNRGASQIIMMLSALWAGSAYVCFDVRTISNRERELVAKLSKNAPVLSDFPVPQVETISFANLVDVAEGVTPISPPQEPDLCHVIFTSGTTGTPKLIPISHSSVIHMVSCVEDLGIDGTDTVLHTQAMNFDVSTFEVWSPLLLGGTLSLPPAGPLALSDIADTITRTGTTTAFFTTGLLKSIVRDDPEILKGIKNLLTGGDVLDAESVRRAFDVESIDTVHNIYGPAEVTVFCTAHTYLRGDVVADVVPLGHSVGRSGVYVLDAEHNPVADDEVGEFAVSGPGLSAGYLGDDSLNSTKFISAPWNSHERLYLTGDLGRRTAGILYFLGRQDDQVKIDGHRVEPEEVRRVISGLPAVIDAVVRPVRGQDGLNELHAWVRSSAANIKEEQVKNEARRRLPPYLVPAQVHFIDRFPLTRAGKIDYEKLTQNSAKRSKQVYDLQGLSTTEHSLVHVWRDVLGGLPSSIDEDFFNAGGSSLKAMRLLSGIRRSLGVRLRAAQPYETRSIRALASFIDSNVDNASESDVLSAADRIGHSDFSQASKIHPLTEQQTALWYSTQISPEKALYNVPLLLELNPDLDATEVGRLVRQVLDATPILRSRLEHGSPSFSLIEQESPETHFHSPQDNEEYERLLLRLAMQPFSAGEVLARSHIIERPMLGISLLFVIHHLIFDAHSEDRLLTRLEEAYRGDLDSLPVRQTTAVPQRLNDARRYWEKILEDIPAPIDLADKNRPRVFTGRGNRLWFDWSFLAGPIQGAAHASGSSFISIVMESYSSTVASFIHRHEFIIGTGLSMSHEHGQNEQMGLHVNTVPIRMRRDMGESVLHRVKAAHESIFSAFDNAEIGLPEILQQLESERDSSRPPLVQVMLAVNHRDSVTGTIGGSVVARKINLPLPVSRVELAASLTVRTNSLTGSIEWCTDLISEQRIKQFLSIWEKELNLVIDSLLNGS